MSFIRQAPREAEVTESRAAYRRGEHSHGNDTSLATLVLENTKKELTSCTQFRVAGISKASIPWMERCSLTFWNITGGTISKERCEALPEHLSTGYTDVYASRKVLNFANVFLKHLAQTHFDTRYKAFELFLEMPKGLKTRKYVVSRIIIKKDIENLLSPIEQAYQTMRQTKTIS